MSAGIDFLLVCQSRIRIVPVPQRACACCRARCWITKHAAPDDGYDFRHAHVLQPISFWGLCIVEPGTVARFPLATTQHAKLGCAATCHVVTALLELDHSLAAIAALPAFLLCRLNKLVHLLVLGAFALRVESAITKRANFRLASRAPAIFPPLISLHIAGLDPLPTPLGRTVQPVFSRIFLVLLVPPHLEFQIEKIVDMLEWNMFRGAAFRRHVCRIGNGHGEDTLQA